MTSLRRPKPGARRRGVVFDSRGFRNPELAVPKPSGTVRIAFLGSSTAFDTFVNGNEATWRHRVWPELSGHFPDVTLDYVNAGLPGHKTPHLLTLHRA